METLATVSEIARIGLGPMGPFILFGLVAVFLALLAVWAIGEQKADPVTKLEGKAKNLTWVSNPSGQSALRDNKQNELLEKYASFLEPEDLSELSEMRKKLSLAGYRSPDAVRLYYLAQVVFGLGLLGLGTLYYMFMVPEEKAGILSIVKFVIVPGALGYLFPKWKLNKQVTQRRQDIQDGFPDTLDMMLICVQAGQSLDQTITRVAKEIVYTCPPMGDELAIVAHELKAGKDRATVLQDFAKRLEIPDISSFVTVMVQSAQFGTSIADALSVYAAEMRDKRIMRAEEKANKLPTKMTLATMMFSVPPLMMILVGPSMLSLGDMQGSGLF